VLDDLYGKELGRYLIGKPLGRGGMATVYQATDALLQRQVAIKVCRPDQENTTNFLRRFIREAQTLASLQHPHILQIFDIGDQDKNAYLVMPYLTGGSLKERLELQPIHTSQEVLRLASQILPALQYAHSKRFIHRDLKPSNILFETSGDESSESALIADFGLVKLLSPDNPEEGLETQSQSGVIIGTPEYMAPEQIQGQATRLSDIYSVGVIFYEMLTGMRPFAAANPTAVQVQHLQRPPRPLRDLNPSISPQVEAVILKTLAKDASQRYQSAQELLHALEQAVASEENATNLTLQPVVSSRPRRSIQMEPAATSLKLLAAPSEQKVLGGFFQRQQNRLLYLPMAIILLIAIIAVTLFYVPADGESIYASTFLTPSTTITIVGELPLKGLDKGEGVPVENGINYALSDANTAHTIPNYTLQFLPMDDTGPNLVHDPATGKANVMNAINNALVAGIIGPIHSSVAAAEMPVANQAPIALISPTNTNPCLTKNTVESGCSGQYNLLPQVRPTGKVTYFRLPTLDTRQGVVAADYLHSVKHYQKVYVIEDQGDLYSDGLASSFIKEWEKTGGTVLPPGNISSSAPYTRYTDVLPLVAPLHPDLIYYSGTTPGGTYIQKAMLETPGLQNIAYAVGDGVVENTFATTLSPSNAPVFGTVPLRDTSTVSDGQSFQQNYQGEGYQNYGLYSASAYDCTEILIQAIKTALAEGVQTPRGSWDLNGAKKFRQAVIDALQHTSYDGKTGHHSFDANGDDTSTDVSIYQFIDTNNSPQWNLLDVR
jgi:branched-chain amino acid transport system substrate-binding protein